jgi:hypothetical protein
MPDKQNFDKASHMCPNLPSQFLHFIQFLVWNSWAALPGLQKNSAMFV